MQTWHSAEQNINQSVSTSTTVEAQSEIFEKWCVEATIVFSIIKAHTSDASNKQNDWSTQYFFKKLFRNIKNMYFNAHNIEKTSKTKNNCWNASEN